jgi:hypothetical protein
MNSTGHTYGSITDTMNSTGHTYGSITDTMNVIKTEKENT